MDDHGPRDPYRVNSIGCDVLVELSGEFDLNTCSELNSRLHDAIDRHPGSTVIVDLRHVGFIDSTTVSVLVRAADYAAAKGGHLNLIEAQGLVLRVLETTGVDQFLMSSPDTAPACFDTARFGHSPT